MEERGSQQGLPMKPEVVAWNLGQVLADDAIICGDSGAVTTWVARMKLRARQNFSFSGTMCSMAAALPYSIGAQTAFPHRQVIAFTGDGSMSMMMGDFATLAQHKLPVKVVVFKNNSLSLHRMGADGLSGKSRIRRGLAPIDFVKVAEACGARGVRIEQPGHCREQLRNALATEGPVLIEAVVDSHEPPQPPKITREQTKHLAERLARGEENRVRIGLTIGRHLIEESTQSASPYGFVGRVASKFGIGGSRTHNGERRAAGDESSGK